MPPTALFLATFCAWLAAKGKLGDYWAFAITKAEGGTPAPVPSTGSGAGSAPVLGSVAALPETPKSSIDGNFWLNLFREANTEDVVNELSK